MAIIKCKICGGEIELPANVTMGECPYCHEVTTFPRFDEPDLEVFYKQAEDARLSSNFDKAIAAYEEIIGRGTTDPEIYWGLVLSTWGIEYVEDPLTKERKPTCHRVQFESILDDENYKKVLELSVGEEQKIYQQEALKIADIQKNILAISSHEKPFDIFICYKESDDSGQRTQDSVFAQELYDKLCAQGYKVFFARVTLEDKVGLYEPYIFSALNSAKVMLVIGSKKEYFEAVWVRNEWSRFLFLMRSQNEKILIPCYRDMDAYDIPREMSMFQAQDMNKIGFTQDLLRGLKKVLGNHDSRTGLPGNSHKVLLLSSAVIAVLVLMTTVLLLRNSNEQKRVSNEIPSKTIENSLNEQSVAVVKKRKIKAKPPQKNENPVVKNLKKYLVIDLSSGPNATSYPVRSTDTPPDIKNDKCRTTELWLRRIEPGDFVMGAPKNALGSLKKNPRVNNSNVTRSGNVIVTIVDNSSDTEQDYNKSLPMHNVSITKPYYIGIFEITQAQFQLVLGETDTLKENKKRDPLIPVTQPTSTRMRDASRYSLMQVINKDVIDNVGWPSCGHNVTEKSFLGVLRTRTGLLFDLPTEAQWEYACRAGTKSSLNSGKNLTYADTDPNLDIIANYKYNSFNKEGNYSLVKVGSYKPNAWGLYDMLGNVEEACLDLYDAPQKMANSKDPLGPLRSKSLDNVNKGGAYNDEAFRCCSYSRSKGYGGAIGFRIVFLPTPLVNQNFGMSWENEDNSIELIWPNFPAEKAGIHEGDVIIEVNDKPLQEDSPNNKWNDLVKPTDTSVKLKLKRGEKVMTITMNR